MTTSGSVVAQDQVGQWLQVRLVATMEGCNGSPGPAAQLYLGGQPSACIPLAQNPLTFANPAAATVGIVAADTPSSAGV